jgi:hypothetical protein
MPLQQSCMVFLAASIGSVKEQISLASTANYSHNSDNRNNIWNADVSFRMSMIILNWF